MKAGFAWFLMFFILGPAFGAEAEDFPLKNDFAYGLQLDIDGAMPLYRVLLPEEVYNVATRQDLGDIRVFNKQGEIVPHFLRRPPPIQAGAVTAVTLPFFPIYGSLQNADKQTLRVETDSKGTIITFNDERVEESPAIAGYIIDCSVLDTPLESIRLQWENKGDSFVTSTSVSYSDDLIDWHTLEQRITLARLRYNGHELVASDILLAAGKAKYLKLDWPVEKGRGPVTAIAGTPRHSKVMHRVYWKELAAIRRYEEPVGYEYDTGSNIPAEELNLVFPYKNILVKAVVSSRPHEDNPWVERFLGIVYSMEADGQVLSSNSFKIPLTADRYWLLEMTSLEGELPDAPRLRLGWIPHEVIFVAQGDAPFVLAYGSAHVEPPPQSAKSFFAAISEENSETYATLDEERESLYGKSGFLTDSVQRTARGKKKVPVVASGISGRVELGGRDQLLPVKRRPWKRWLLWAAMLVGLAVLGRMAWVLNKEMQAPDKKEMEKG